MIFLYILHIRYYTRSGKLFFYIHSILSIKGHSQSLLRTNKMKKRGERGLIIIFKSIISLCRLCIILENVTYAYERFGEFYNFVHECEQFCYNSTCFYRKILHFLHLPIPSNIKEIKIRKRLFDGHESNCTIF